VAKSRVRKAKWQAQSVLSAADGRYWKYVAGITFWIKS
jgi:hypothetical protein